MHFIAGSVHVNTQFQSFPDIFQSDAGVRAHCLIVSQKPAVGHIKNEVVGIDTEVYGNI
jgi:hypothetical protein